MRNKIAEKISINVEPKYIEEQSDPDKNKYVFSYDVTIRNKGEVGVQLLARHWLITDANERTKEVLGEGVVGKQPHLDPDDKFTYTSWAILETPTGLMHGTYHLVDEEGESFETDIPAFTLSTPNTLH